MTRILIVWKGFDSRKIKLDNDDYEKLRYYLWHLDSRSTLDYFYRREGTESLYLHKEILDADGSIQVDHINGDSLDNRRLNLRRATPAENSRNTKPRLHTSKYKGVFWDNQYGMWHARICVNDKQVFLGRYTKEDDAGSAYNYRAVVEFGEFARLNIISPTLLTLKRSIST